MAEVVRYVDPDASGSGNGTSWTDAYTTLSAWQTAEATNLVSDGDTHHLYVRGTISSVFTLTTAWTTGEGNGITIEVPSVSRHDGTGGSGARIATTDDWDAAFQIDIGYVTVIGLAVSNQSANAGYGFHLLADNILLNKCLVYDCGSYGIYNASGTKNIVRNTAIYSCSNGVWASQSIILQNVTILNSGTYGVHVTDWDTVTATNVYVGGSGTADWSKTVNGTLTLTTCASSDGSQSTTTVAMSTSSGAYFSNVTPGSEDAHIGASSDMVAAGTDLSGTFTDDWDGDTRTSWDIGADEYVAAGGTTYDVSTSDGVSISDTVTANATIIVTATDGSVFTDAPISAYTILGAIIDGVSISDSAGGIATIQATVSDGVTYTEAISTIIQFLITAQDGISATDVSIESSNTAQGFVQITITAGAASVIFMATRPEIIASESAPVINITTGV